MAKSPAEYLAEDRTDNQEQFLAWVIAETGTTFKSAGATEAFALGVKAAGLYGRYQASKRSTAPAVPTAPTKASAKASAE
jgi:hypothetical protein